MEFRECIELLHTIPISTRGGYENKFPLVTASTGVYEIQNI